MMDLLAVQNLSYYYPGQKRPALKHIDLQVKKGEILGVIGLSGCGKSTLLRVISRLIPDFYGGSLAGDVFFRRRSLRDFSHKELYRSLGALSQQAEHSLIFDQVRRDIAFGLENLGLSNSEMERRIGDVLEYFDLSKLACRSIHDLSGGEKQKTALAGIVAMQPELLVLDEPAGQLDEDSARELLRLLSKLNKEREMTIVIAEQNLGWLFELADRVVVMEAGEVIFSGKAAEQYDWALRHDYPLTSAACSAGGEQAYAGALPKREEALGVGPAAAFYELDHQYDQTPVLKNISLRLYPGQITVLTGDNGAGKTTLLKVILGLLKPGGGKIAVLGRQGKELRPEIIGREAAYLPQNLDHYFITDTVLAEVELGMKSGREKEVSAQDWLAKFQLSQYLEQDPRNLSAGEKQRAAIASLAAADPRLIILDEPARGLDIMQKRVLGSILTELAGQGKAIVLASHDRDFVNAYADRVISLKQGRVINDELRNTKRRETL